MNHRDHENYYDDGDFNLGHPSQWPWGRWGRCTKGNASPFEWWWALQSTLTTVNPRPPSNKSVARIYYCSTQDQNWEIVRKITWMCIFRFVTMVLNKCQKFSSLRWPRGHLLCPLIFNQAGFTQKYSVTEGLLTRHVHRWRPSEMQISVSHKLFASTSKINEP